MVRVGWCEASRGKKVNEVFIILMICLFDAITAPCNFLPARGLGKSVGSVARS